MSGQSLQAAYRTLSFRLIQQRRKETDVGQHRSVISMASLSAGPRGGEVDAKNKEPSGDEDEWLAVDDSTR